MGWRRPKSVWKRGEDAAARYMRKNGHRILARNLTLGMGEIDLLCQDKRTRAIVIVEVKARAYHTGSTRDIDPIASITAKKRSKLRLLARAIKKQPRYALYPIRIDAIAVRFDDEPGGPHRRNMKLTHYPSCIGAD